MMRFNSPRFNKLSMTPASSGLRAKRSSFQQMMLSIPPFLIFATIASKFGRLYGIIADRSSVNVSSISDPKRAAMSLAHAVWAGRPGVAAGTYVATTTTSASGHNYASIIAAFKRSGSGGSLISYTPLCKTGASGGGIYTTGTSKVFYSIPSSNLISQNISIDVNASASQATDASGTLTDGTGWIPVPFDQLFGGAPISNEPVDPVNSVANPASGTTNADLAYRYACNGSTAKWEADAVLESQAYTATENKMAKDGGNNPNYYEVGTDLKILGTGTNF